MAGEIDEPFGFQADTLHSGSISFGRFDTESLCWERRSSFSHNRYLEEVEKYSTPGSVNQKKAYFEAHFKKKALLRQASSECQNGMEYQSSEHSIQDHTNYMEEFEHEDEECRFAHFDESLDGSDYHADHEVEHEMGGEEISPSESQIEPTDSSVNLVLVGDLQHVEPGEKLQTQLESGTLLSVNDGPEIEVEHKIYHEAENVDGLPKSTEPSLKSLRSGKDDNSRLKMPQNISPKVKVTAESKTAKPKLTAQATVCQVPRKVSSEASKDFAKNPRKIEKESQLRTKTVEQFTLKIPPTTCSPSRTMQPGEPENSRTKLSEEHRSEKDKKSRRKKMDTLPSASKSESIEHQTADRTRRNVRSTKPCTKHSAVVFHFKSDERAEKRKEFCTKLEEKMHAREVEMNQIQAKTQEKTESEIKQFRRSLDFKATPMPSFYHDAVAQSSDNKKIVSSQVKSTKSRCKSTSPGSKSATGSPAFSISKAENHPTPFSELADTPRPIQATEVTDCPTNMPSEASNSSPTSTNRTCTGRRVVVAGKKGKDKEKDTNLPKHQASDSRMRRGERFESRQTRGGVLNPSSDLVKKAMRCVSDRGSSGVGHIAVHVTS